MRVLRKLRKKTTHKAHFHLLDKINWYKKWHDFKYHHHVHLGLLLFMVFSVVLSLFVFPRVAFAGLTEQSITISTEAEFNQGTLTDTKTNGDQVELEPDVVDHLSNSGGGTWQYRRPITIDNSGGEELTDYQIEIDSEKGAVGHWNFDEISGTTAFDSSWQDNNGNVVGATRVDSKSGYGKALSFNGTSDYYVDFGTPESLDVSSTDEITLSAWIYPTGSQGDERGTIITKSGSYYMQCLNNGTVGVYTYPDSGSSTYFYSISTLSLNQWNHITFTENSSGYRKIYVNGDFDNGGQFEASIRTHTNPTRVGMEITTRRFRGYIDEPRIYNKALSDSEVANLYNQMESDATFFSGAKSDGSDARFTDSNGETEIPYWIESFNNNTNGIKNYKIWTKVPNIPASSKDIYMYYGNSNATNSSNGSSTFIYYENFDSQAIGAVPSGWSVSGTGDVTIQNVPTSGTLSNNKSMRVRGTLDSSTLTATKSLGTITSDVVLEYYNWYSTLNKHYITQMNNIEYLTWPNSPYNWQYRNNSGTWTTFASGWTTGRWYNFRAETNKSSSQYQINIDSNTYTIPSPQPPVQLKSIVFSFEGER